LPGVSVALGWALRGMVSAHAAWLITPGDLRGEHFWAPLVLAVVVAAQWALLERLGNLPRGGFVALALVPAAMVAAAVLIHAHTARLSDLATVLMGSLLGTGTVALVMGREAAGIAPAAAVLLPGLLLSGQHETFSEVPKTSFVLSALSPLMLAPLLIPVWRRNQPKGLWVMQIALLLLPMVAAIWLAAHYESLDFE